MNISGIDDIYELIGRARSGEQIAFEKLKNAYEPLINSQVSKHMLPDMNSHDAEDLRQEALIVFCRAVLSYDTDRREVEFGLYAKICIEHGLSSFLRSYRRSDRTKVVPLYDGVYTEPANDGDMLQRLVAREHLGELVGLIERSLSEFELKVWWLYASGMTASQIARELEVSDPRTVTNAVYRIRKKLREKLGSQK